MSTARDSAQQRLVALTRVSAAGGVALASACIFGACDMMPDPPQCSSLDSEERVGELSGTARWVGTDLAPRLEIDLSMGFVVGQRITDPIRLTGATLVSRDDASGEWALVLVVDPDEGADSVVVSGNVTCGFRSTPWTATIDLASAPGPGDSGDVPIDVVIE